MDNLGNFLEEIKKQEESIEAIVEEAKKLSLIHI